MRIQTDERTSSVHHHRGFYACGAAILVTAVGACVLAGWVTDLRILRSFVPAGIEMKLNTALAFVCAGAALALHVNGDRSSARQAIGKCLGGLIALIGAASFLEWILGVDLGIDQLLATEHPGAKYTSAPGRMAPNTALCLVCDGLALVLLDWRLRSGLRPAQILCLVQMTIALLALLVFMYGVGAAYSQTGVTQMAMHTAVTLLVLSTGILSLRPKEGLMSLITSSTRGGLVARRVLPAAIVLPLLIAYGCLKAIEVHGWPVGLGFATLEVSTVVILASLVGWCAHSLLRADEDRERAAEMVRLSAQEVASANERLRVLADERRQAQEKLQELARDLAVSNAESANEAKSAFLTNMSHELRTPLNAIIGFSQMLEDRLFGELNAKQAKHVNHIQVGGRHLLKLINEILDLSTIETGKLELELGPVDMHVIASEVHDTTHALAADKHLGLAISVPSLRFIGDSGRIRQILLNLVANAIKFTPDGGHIEVRASAIADDRGRWIRISVQDSGIGIKRDDLDRLFVEFGRLDDSYARTTEGSGLGLALTKRLVELHGGSISVVSNGLGTGSTFSVDLPENPALQLVSDAGTDDLPGHATSQPPMQSSRGLVLVVDDEPSTQEMLADALTSDRYEVMVASDVNEALAHVAKRPPMAVILDIALANGASGWEILEILHASPHTRNIPVITLSALDERTLARNLGARDALLKPVDRERLLAVVNTVIRRQQRNRTALVVDDDPMIVKYLSFALRERGWNVITALSGNDAVEIAERQAPDIAVVDQSMPDLAGVELLDRFSRIPATAHMPVVLHADQPPSEGELALLDPQRHAVVKKLQSEALLAEIERLCDASRTVQPPVVPLPGPAR